MVMFIMVSLSDIVTAVLLEFSSELSQATVPLLDVFPEPLPPHTHTNEELQVGPDSSDYQRVECAETSTFYPIQPGEKGTEEIERPDNPGP